MKRVQEGEPPITALRPAARRSATSSLREQALQIKIILLPLDFSRASMEALKYAIPLAEQFRAAIHLVHVQPADSLTGTAHAGHLMLNCADAIALMQDRLAEAEEKTDVRFWPDNCHVVSGRPFEEIVKLAHKLAADLIVLPTRGYSGLKHVLLGSTAERVVRHAPCPVLVLRGAKYRAALSRAARMGGLKPGAILVPVDFSKCSLTGAKYAARLAQSTGATLRLLHVVYPYAQSFGMERAGEADATTLIETAKAAAREQMSELMQMDFLRGIPCKTEVRAGPAIDEICGQSAQPGIDLVVTSTHGRSGVKRALLGSVAEHVVRYAECPVMTVPSRGRC